MSEQERIDFEDELRRYARAEPFAPFDIVISSGDRYHVTDSWQVAIGGNTVVVTLPKTGIRFFRKEQVVAVHVEESTR